MTQAVWEKLEVPQVQQYQFLCKYSNPRYAGDLQTVIGLLEQLSELIGKEQALVRLRVRLMSTVPACA